MSRGGGQGVGSPGEIRIRGFRGGVADRCGRHLGELVLSLKFHWRAFLYKTMVHHIVVMDNPRFAVGAAAILRWKFNCKITAWVMDLAFEQVRRRSRGFSRASAAFLLALQIRALRIVDRVVTLGSCMSTLLGKLGVPSGKLTVIGTWASDSWVALKERPTEQRKKFGIPEKFTVMYSGHAGAWHDFATISAAVSQLRADDSIQWIFAGSGPGITTIEAIGAENVVIHPAVDRADLPGFLSCADLHLVSLHPAMLGTCVPSKLYPLMALGLPILFVGPKECQSALDLKEYEMGFIAEDVGEMVDVLRALSTRSNSSGRSGFQAGLEKREAHTLGHVFPSWRKVLEN